MGKAASRMAHNDFYHLVITHLCLEVHKCVITPSLKVDGREQPTSKRASQVANPFPRVSSSSKDTTAPAKSLTVDLKRDYS